MAIKINYKKNGKEYYHKTITIGKNQDDKAICKEFYRKIKMI